GQVPALLLRMPVFVGHPARGLGAEHDRRHAPRRPRTDAVAAGEVAVELAFGDVAGLRIEGARAADAVDREAAQRLAVVVPGVEVPVVPVVGDALRGHRAPGLLVGRARAVVEGELLALQHRRAHGAERLLVHAPAAVRDHAHAFDRPVLAGRMLVEQLVDARLQRRQRARQHPATAAREQLLGGQQRVQFVGIEPQAGQFEAPALLGVVAEAGFAVADHRRHQRVAQEGQVAVDRGAGAFELFAQARHRDRVARGLEDAVQGKDAFVSVHVPDYAPPGAGWSRFAGHRAAPPAAGRDCSRAAGHAPCAPVRAKEDDHARGQQHDIGAQCASGGARVAARLARAQTEAGMALWLTLAVLVGAIALFVTEKLRVDVVALLVMTALMVTGVITVPEALSGFSSQATVMVAAMFVLSGALQRNGALVAVGEVLSRIRWQWLFMLVMLVLVASVAAFVNNTATVAVFLPLVLAASTANRWAPSKFLIPLSYMSQAAGVCTLIGTSTNLLVDAMGREAVGVGFTLFEFAPLGIVFVGICMLYLMTVGRWLLPDRGVPGSEETEHVGRYVAELLVPPDSDAIGLRREQVVPESIDDAVVLEILRRGRPVSSAGTVEAGDRLLVRGEWRQVRAVRKARKLRVDHVAGDIDGDAADAERVQVEAMVSPGSHLIGNTLAGMRFGHMYRARVQGIHRRLLDIRQPLDQVQLSLGDVLLLDAPEP